MISLQDVKRSAIRYWERRRLFYNLALILPALLGFHSGSVGAARHGLVRDSGTEIVLLLFVLWAIPANICYTFAYALEFLFASDTEDSWWLENGRTTAFVSGTVFAMVLAFIGGIDVGWMVFKQK